MGGALPHRQRLAGRLQDTHGLPSAARPGRRRWWSRGGPRAARAALRTAPSTWPRTPPAAGPGSPGPRASGPARSRAGPRSWSAPPPPPGATPDDWTAARLCSRATEPSWCVRCQWPTSRSWARCAGTLELGLQRGHRLLDGLPFEVSALVSLARGILVVAAHPPGRDRGGGVLRAPTDRAGTSHSQTHGELRGHPVRSASPGGRDGVRGGPVRVASPGPAGCVLPRGDFPGRPPARRLRGPARQPRRATCRESSWAAISPVSWSWGWSRSRSVEVRSCSFSSAWIWRSRPATCAVSEVNRARSSCSSRSRGSQDSATARASLVRVAASTRPAGRTSAGLRSRSWATSEACWEAAASASAAAACAFSARMAAGSTERGPAVGIDRLDEGSLDVSGLVQLGQRALGTLAAGPGVGELPAPVTGGAADLELVGGRRQGAL